MNEKSNVKSINKIYQGDWDINYLTDGIIADYFYQNEARLGKTLEENHNLKLKSYQIIKERIIEYYTTLNSVKDKCNG